MNGPMRVTSISYIKNKAERKEKDFWLNTTEARKKVTNANRKILLAHRASLVPNPIWQPFQCRPISFLFRLQVEQMATTTTTIIINNKKCKITTNKIVWWDENSTELLNRFRYIVIISLHREYTHFPMLMIMWNSLTYNIIFQCFIYHFFLCNTLVLPTQGPKIVAEQSLYTVGDEIVVNCTSDRSNLEIYLNFTINGEPVMNIQV